MKIFNNRNKIFTVLIYLCLIDLEFGVPFSCFSNQCSVNNDCKSIREVCDIKDYYELCNQICNGTFEYSDINEYSIRCIVDKDINTKLCPLTPVLQISFSGNNDFFKLRDSVVIKCDVIRGLPGQEIYIKHNKEITKNLKKIKNLTKLDAGTYSCYMTKNNVEYKVENNLTVYGYPEVNIKKKNVLRNIYLVGDSISLWCNILIHDLKPTFQWKKDGVDIMDKAKDSILIKDTLYIENAKLKDTGRYECIVTNSIGSTTAFIDIKVDITVMLKIKIKDREEILEVARGNTIALDCPHSYDSKISHIFWRHNRRKVYRKEKLVETPSLTIKNAQESDEGEYECFIESRKLSVEKLNMERRTSGFVVLYIILAVCGIGSLVVAVVIKRRKRSNSPPQETVNKGNKTVKEGNNEAANA